ncbi:prolyl oligopeptidase family serine peptidase [Chitinophaga sp. MM2321]|uniref:carboxylesterase family protein n=1 Tax=Chitinophaga sp. MM2321 TaxID=3137178 RepID=UPI0032D59760
MKKRAIKLFSHVFVLSTLALFSCSKTGELIPVVPPATPIDTVAKPTPPPVKDTLPSQTNGITVQDVNSGGANITNYLLYIPDGYNENQDKWPIVISLHGVGEIGSDINVVRNTGLPKVVKGKPFIMVAPQCRSNWWNADALEVFYKAIMAKYRIDPSRVYLTGLSMGGMLTWSWAEAHPEHFAAIIPIAGNGDVKQVSKIKNTPVWAFHSANDGTVSVNGSRDMVNALKAIGGNVKYTEYPDGGHDSWTRAYATPELYTWLLQQHK